MIAQIVTLFSFEMVARHACAFERHVTHIVCFALGETMADKDSNSKESRFYAKHPVIFGILFAIIPCLLTAYLGDLHGQSEIVDELSKRFDSVEESMSLNDALESAYKDYANVEAELNALKDEEAGKQVLADARAAWDSGKHEEALTTLQKASKKSGDCAVAFAEYSSTYTDEVLAQANELVSSKKYDEAKSVLKTASKIVKDPARINDLLDELEGVSEVALTSLTVASSSRFELIEGSQKDTAGNSYSSDDTWVGRPNSADSPSVISFYIGKKYRSLNGKIAVEYVEDTSILKDYEARLELRGSVDGSDSKVIWQKDHITMNTAPTDIPSNEIDLSDFDWLEFRVYSTKGYTGNGIPVLLSNVKLIKE